MDIQSLPWPCSDAMSAAMPCGASTRACGTRARAARGHGLHCGTVWRLHHRQSAGRVHAGHALGAILVGAGQQHGQQALAIAVGSRLEQHIDRGPRKMPGRHPATAPAWARCPPAGGSRPAQSTGSPAPATAGPAPRAPAGRSAARKAGPAGCAGRAAGAVPPAPKRAGWRAAWAAPRTAHQARRPSRRSRWPRRLWRRPRRVCSWSRASQPGPLAVDAVFEHEVLEGLRMP